MVHVRGALGGAQGHPLEVQGRLGDLRLPNGRVALLPQLDVELRERRDLPRHLLELLLHPGAKLFVDGDAGAALDLDAHLPSLGSRLVPMVQPAPRGSKRRGARSAGSAKAPGRRRPQRPAVRAKAIAPTRRAPAARSAAAHAARVAPVVTTSSTSRASRRAGPVASSELAGRYRRAALPRPAWRRSGPARRSHSV